MYVVHLMDKFEKTTNVVHNSIIRFTNALGKNCLKVTDKKRIFLNAKQIHIYQKEKSKENTCANPPGFYMFSIAYVYAMVNQHIKKQIQNKADYQTKQDADDKQ